MSATEYELHGRAKDGKIIPSDPVSFSLALSALNGKPIVIKMKERRPNRSLSQNSAWHAIVVPIFAQCYGEDNLEAAHYTLLRHIHYEVCQDMNGRLRRKVKRTHMLSTVEFCELYEKAQRFIADEYGVFVPDPDPNWKARKTVSEART